MFVKLKRYLENEETDASIFIRQDQIYGTKTDMTDGRSATSLLTVVT
jgi:hypothetical protein